MAIKVQSIQLNPTTKKANVSLFLDTQADINSGRVVAIKIPSSDGTWNWV